MRARGRLGLEDFSMADFGADTALEEFRAEARAWLDANFPASLKGKAGVMMALMDGPEAQGDIKLWQQRLGEKGWGTPTWPAEYGGGGLDGQQARVLQQEMNRAGAFNALSFGMGITMVGPTILDYGTEDQKKKHLPPIIKGEVRWCIGYSEPNAGSDLASLQMKCEDKGDHYLINGSKIWTSGAQYSDWCGALVRTDPSAKKKHDGISFILIDMRQPGVETRPIKLIAGASPFCETFFTDAKASKDSILGQLNVGWTVGKRLLQHERASQMGTSMGGRVVPLEDLAKQYVGVDEKGRIADSDLRTRLTKHAIDARAHAQTLARIAAETKGGSNANTTASILKNSATWVAQTRAELTLEIMGQQGLGWEGDAFKREEIEAVRGWLSGKAMSIYGGSQEIQNNIITKAILGLPETTQQG
jgi:alkylation response protein AidB-like acyl-CoA dehydrogenase